MRIVAGVDLGGTAVNYTLLSENEEFLIEGLCEHPARVQEGPEICLWQIVEGLEIALASIGADLRDVVAVGLDTPGPASANGVLSARGSTNFVHAEWAGFDIRKGVEQRVGKPVSYLNDGNAAAMWGHFSVFGAVGEATSLSVVIGTGLGGGIILQGEVVFGRVGFGGELGHVLVPYQSIPRIAGLEPHCNCGRTGCLESVCSLGAIERSLLPFFLKQYIEHQLGKIADARRAATLVRGLAEKGDAMCREIFRVQARALGLFLDQMVNVFDYDAVIVGGGALETSPEFQAWFLEEVRAAMPTQREEQKDLPIHVMPNGDTAGARGAAIHALRLARQKALSGISKAEMTVSRG